jgi:hypothetical protein
MTSDERQLSALMAALDGSPAVEHSAATIAVRTESQSGMAAAAGEEGGLLKGVRPELSDPQLTTTYELASLPPQATHELPTPEQLLHRVGMTPPQSSADHTSQELGNFVGLSSVPVGFFLQGCGSGSIFGSGFNDFVDPDPGAKK